MNTSEFQVYEVSVFHGLGDHLLHYLHNNHPRVVTGVRIDAGCSFCTDCNNEVHDHFILMFKVRFGLHPTIFDVERILLLRLYYDDYRPFKSKFLSWNDFAIEMLYPTNDDLFIADRRVSHDEKLRFDSFKVHFDCSGSKTLTFYRLTTMTQMKLVMDFGLKNQLITLVQLNNFNTVAFL
jgi:hypothetical protein